MEVYIDNASTTKMSKNVINSMLPYFDTYFGNASSLHTYGQKAKEAILKSKEEIADIFNCSPKEIIFTSGGTESNNQAILSASTIGLKNNKKHIITSKIEHPAVLNSIKKLEKNGFNVTYLDVDKNGLINIEELKNSIKKDTCLVSIMFANNEIGTIQPIEEIGKICKENNIIFHTDAVQAVSQIKIDVKKLNIDMLSLSAHKFHGPKGIGLLYFNHNLKMEKLIQGGSQERNLRAGTENIASIIGLKVALIEAYKNLEINQEKISTMQNYLIEELSKIPNSKLNGDRFNRLKNNINFSFKNVDGEALLLLLNDKNIYASAGSACSSGALNSSHVINAIGNSKEFSKGTIRLSLSEENTMEEMNYVVENIKNIVSYLRKMSPNKEN